MCTEFVCVVRSGILLLTFLLFSFLFLFVFAFCRGYKSDMDLGEYVSYHMYHISQTHYRPHSAEDTIFITSMMITGKGKQGVNNIVLC